MFPIQEGTTPQVQSQCQLSLSLLWLPKGRSSAEDADLEALPSATEIPRNEW